MNPGAERSARCQFWGRRGGADPRVQCSRDVNHRGTHDYTPPVQIQPTPHPDRARLAGAAGELSRRLGIPVTDVGDGTCCVADDTPDTAARFMLERLAGAQSNERDRFLVGILGWLRRTEDDWERLRLAPMTPAAMVDADGFGVWANAIQEAKAQRDAELVALFDEIGMGF